MTPPSHDTLVVRLAQILMKLNQGEALSPKALAEEFGVTLRTIQRDLHERFAYLPLIKTGNRYRLDPVFLGKLTLRDIERFASLAGVRGLFPSLSDDFLRDVFDARIQRALLVKGHHYENLAGKEGLFHLLEQAIIAHCTIAFLYRKDESEKHYTDIEPYKLMNHKGIWYLAGKDQGKLKTFSFTKLERLSISTTRFTPDPTIDQTLNNEEGIWLSDVQMDVVLQASKSVAGYFKRRPLIANQILQQELEDGGLILSAKVGHPNQILPIVRYWIPHLRILSPETLQTQMEDEIRAYLTR